MSKTGQGSEKTQGAPLRLLLIEDNPTDAGLLVETLEEAGLRVSAERVDTLPALAEQVRTASYDLILSDYRLPAWTGLEALAYLQKQGKDIPFILVTGTLGDELAAEAVRRGVWDYVLKDRLKQLPVAVRRVLEVKALRDAQVLRILLLEDNPTDIELCRHALEEGGLRIRLQAVATAGDFVQCIENEHYDVILGDYRLPGWTAMDALARLKERGLDIPFILVTGTLGDELAADCVRRGVWDYVLKDRLNRLPVAVRLAAENAQMREKRRQAELERARLMTAIEQAAEAVMITDAEGRIEYVNPAFTWITGYAREEVMGQNPRLLKSGQQDVLFYKSLWETIRAGKVWQGELINRRKDGSLYPEEMSITPVRARNGGITNFIALKQDVTERKRHEEHLRELSGRLLAVQDEERRRLARELHDTTSQTLAALVLNLSSLQETAAADAGRAASLASCQELAEQAAREIRTFSYLLHPPLLEEMGLVSALRAYVEGFTQRSGIAVELEVPPVQTRFPPELELALFRVAQESLANVHRHSGSRRARLCFAAGARDVRLEVSDGGRGLLPEVLEKFARGGGELGVGLAGMRERLRQLGGRLEVFAEKPGTTVRATLPLPELKP